MIKNRIVVAGSASVLFSSNNNRANDQDRTGDLILTMDVLYQLSYIGRKLLERKTGLEPATLSLEG